MTRCRLLALVLAFVALALLAAPCSALDTRAAAARGRRAMRSASVSAAAASASPPASGTRDPGTTARSRATEQSARRAAASKAARPATIMRRRGASPKKITKAPKASTRSVVGLVEVWRKSSDRVTRDGRRVPRLVARLMLEDGDTVGVPLEHLKSGPLRVAARQAAEALLAKQALAGARGSNPFDVLKHLKALAKYASLGDWLYGPANEFAWVWDEMVRFVDAKVEVGFVMARFVVQWDQSPRFVFSMGGTDNMRVFVGCGVDGGLLCSSLRQFFEDMQSAEYDWGS